jgi:ArsR family transcriptional regulator, arsenate/arsenite/antimonite-responsive transcriptional repressor
MNAVRPVLPERHKNVVCCDPSVAPMLERAQANAIANTVKALSDPTRVQLLHLLVQQPGPLCVCDLIPRFAQHQPTISHHLRILREAGLLETEKRGIWSHYWATDRGRETLSAALAVAGKQ